MPVPTPSVTRTTSVVASDWVDVDMGVTRFDERVSDGTAAARMIIWRIQPEANLTWSIVTSTGGSVPLSRFADENSSRVVVLNGGYFHPDGLPSGWVQMNGSPIGTRRFDADKSGLVLLGDKPRLLAGTIDVHTIIPDALQSYPWLIRQGVAAFTKETGQYARRTFVGVDVDGNWYVGVIPSESVTLYQLAQLILQVPTKWRDVMNLDGGPSTGLIAQMNETQDRFDSFAPVAYAIVGRRRP